MKINNYNNYIELYKDNIEKNTSIGSLTKKAYTSDINLYTKWLKSNITHQEINLADITDYFDYLRAMMKPSTVKRHYVSLKKLHVYIDEEHEEHSLMKKVSIKYPNSRSLPKTLNTREINRLLKTSRNDIFDAQSDFQFKTRTRDYAILILLVTSGARINEISKLTIKDLNLSERTMLINGKGNKQRFMYLASNDVVKALRDWLKIRLKIRTENNYLFLNKYHEKLSIYSIENIFYKYRDLANINPLSTPHYLRHSFASKLIDNGADIRSVQELLGHASVVTTQIYTEVSIAKKKSVLKKYGITNNLNII